MPPHDRPLLEDLEAKCQDDDAQKAEEEVARAIGSAPALQPYSQKGYEGQQGVWHDGKAVARSPCSICRKAHTHQGPGDEPWRHF